MESEVLRRFPRRARRTASSHIRMAHSGTPSPPPAGSNAARRAVLAGPDGGVRCTLWGANRPARLGPDGGVSEVALPGAEPHGLTVGPDGVLWVALESGALARVRGW